MQSFILLVLVILCLSATAWLAVFFIKPTRPGLYSIIDLAVYITGLYFLFRYLISMLWRIFRAIAGFF